jgi:murein DD-endopeptidase MepM/ murein hydrolase activator NlpD
VLVCIAIVGGALLWRQSVGGPELRLVESPRLLGRKAAVDLQLRAQGGRLSTVRITLEQGDRVYDLFASDSLRTNEATLSAALNLRASGATEGEARLVFYVGDDFWRPRKANDEPTLKLPVLVDLTPPPLQIRSATRYPEPGGAALAVLFAPGAEECFVEIGGRRFAAHARGEESLQLSLYAVPLDYDGKSPPTAVATDAAGNRSVAELPVVIRAKAVATGSVDLSEQWLTRELPELLDTDVEEIRKDLGAAFRRVSVDLRAEALAQREALAAASVDVALWSGAFQQLPNSSVLSRFGVRRTYRLGGQELDEKVHQGFDLASVRHAKIPAANAGRVVWAGPLTIYGNTVIVDHGLSLMTLYGHCSSLQVAVGDTVERGQTIALSGATGLAVGDHLHFEVVVGGVPVTPLQWFDRSWIESHIESVARDGGAVLRDGGN